MNIELKELIPVPLLESAHETSEIWEKESVVFNADEFTVITAGSGKGKTSLLSCIYGIRKDFRGDILINGKSVRDFRSRKWSEIRKKSMGYIFQGLELFDELTARQNILLKNKISGLKSESEIKNLAGELEMDIFLDRPAAILSWGQKQRIAIIRALCQEMEFLLADEIFSHLDKKLAATALNMISRELKSQGAGLILTSLNREDIPEIDRRLNL